MPYLAILAFLGTASLFAVELAELKRSEDWETHLSEAARLARDQKFAPAEALYRTLIAAAREFSFPLLLQAKCRHNYAAMLSASGRYVEAEGVYKEAGTLWIASAGAHSDEYAKSLNNLAEVYRNLGRHTEAETAYQSSIAVRESLLQRHNMQLAVTLNNLALEKLHPLGDSPGTPAGNGKATTPDLDRKRRIEEAEGAFQRSLRIKREVLGPNHPDVATSLNNLASLLQQTGDAEGAEEFYRQALAIRESQTPLDRPALAGVLNNLGTLHRRTGKLESAESHMRRANQLWEEALGTSHPSVAVGLNNLAELLMGARRLSEAEPLFRRSIEISEESLGEKHAQTATALDGLGVLFLQQEKGPGAEALFRRAVAARSASLGSVNLLTLESMHHLAQAIQLQGRFTEADRLLDEELTLVQTNRWNQSAHHGHILSAMILNHLAQRRYAEAGRLLGELSGFSATLPESQRAEVGELSQAYARVRQNSRKEKNANQNEEKARGFRAR